MIIDTFGIWFVMMQIYNVLNWFYMFQIVQIRTFRTKYMVYYIGNYVPYRSWIRLWYINCQMSGLAASRYFYTYISIAHWKWFKNSCYYKSSGSYHCNIHCYVSYFVGIDSINDRFLQFYKSVESSSKCKISKSFGKTQILGLMILISRSENDCIAMEEIRDKL